MKISEKLNSLLMENVNPCYLQKSLQEIVDIMLDQFNLINDENKWVKKKIYDNLKQQA